MSYDSYSSKSTSVAKSAVTSQPGVGGSTTQYHPLHTSGSTFAQPPETGSYVSPAAQSYHVDERAQQEQLQQNLPVRPPIGRWRDSICDCTNNLFPSCYCVCCCYYGMWLVAQMAQKTGLARFSSVIGATALFWLLGLLLTFATGSGLFILIIPLLFSFVAALVLRLHIVREENLTECTPFGEFCCGFLCWYCSVAQMARHLYGYKKQLDGDGDPDRPDSYAPVSTQV